MDGEYDMKKGNFKKISSMIYYIKTEAYIKDKGAKMISEVLMINTTLTAIDLRCKIKERKTNERMNEF